MLGDDTTARPWLSHDAASLSVAGQSHIVLATFGEYRAKTLPGCVLGEATITKANRGAACYGDSDAAV